MNKVVLAYSGGLDTSVAVAWLHEQYDTEVITLTVDVGGGSLREGVERRCRQQDPNGGNKTVEKATTGNFAHSEFLAGRPSMPLLCGIAANLGILMVGSGEE